MKKIKLLLMILLIFSSCVEEPKILMEPQVVTLEEYMSQLEPFKEIYWYGGRHGVTLKEIEGAMWHVYAKIIKESNSLQMEYWTRELDGSPSGNEYIDFVYTEYSIIDNVFIYTDNGNIVATMELIKNDLNVTHYLPDNNPVVFTAQVPRIVYE